VDAIADAAQSGFPAPAPRAADMKFPVHFASELASADCQIATAGSDSVQGASVNDCGLMAESRNVRKEKNAGWQAVPAGSAQVIRTSTRFANSMGRGHLDWPFPRKSTKARRQFKTLDRTFHHSSLRSKTLANASFCYRLRPNAPPGIEKAPGRLTTGALAAPFSPGGSIKAATEIISVVRKNLTSNHRKDCVAIFAPSLHDSGQYLETANALTATHAGSGRSRANVVLVSGFRGRSVLRARHTCPETLRT
jgi:hypothetical protein